MSEVVADQPPEPVSRGWARGWHWIREATLLFRKRPGTLILGGLLFFIFLILVGSVPFVGSLATSLLSPVLSAGFISAFARADAGTDITFPDLLEGFRRQTGALVAVGAWLLFAEVVLFVVVAGAGWLLVGFEPEVLMQAMETGELGAYATGIVLMGLAFVLLVIPLLMAYWFAPALVILDEVSPLQAFRLSFDGCMLNLPPFLWYGLVAVLLVVIATLPMLLGWLILGPVLLGSQYTSYRDIYRGPRGTLLP